MENNFKLFGYKPVVLEMGTAVAIITISNSPYSLATIVFHYSGYEPFPCDDLFQVFRGSLSIKMNSGISRYIQSKEK